MAAYVVSATVFGYRLARRLKPVGTAIVGHGYVRLQAPCKAIAEYRGRRRHTRPFRAAHIDHGGVAMREYDAVSGITFFLGR